MGLKKEQINDVAMPLTHIGVGERVRVLSVVGTDDIKHHLGSLGFVPGAIIVVMQLSYGNMILGIHDSRIAIGGALADRIFVERVK